MKSALISLIAASCWIAAGASPDPRTMPADRIASGALSCLRWPNFQPIQPQVRKLYESSGYRLLWVRDGAPTAQALQVAEILRRAGTKGLDPEDYDGPRWGVRLARLRPACHQPLETDLEEFDLAMTVSAIRYLSDLHVGKVNPASLCYGYDVDAKRCDIASFVQENVLNSADVERSVTSLEPPYEGYRLAKQALQTYMALARQDDGVPLPTPSKTVSPGDPYAGVPALERRLRLLGDLPRDAPACRPEIYEGALVEAVRHFQVRHGLDPDGRIGSKTLAQLNTPLSQRIRQLQLVLERWRWAPVSFSRPPVVVNIPEFRLRAFNQRFETELDMKVVVGGAYRHQTPLFAASMTHLIFRPYWNVPLSIQRTELVPKLSKDPAYLGKETYEVVNARNEVVATSSVTPDMLRQLRSGRLSIRQVPGAKNALGFVKFLFPNEHDVYLHGTPAKALFSRSRRDFSHGCIRVEKPEELALWVLRDQPEWDLDRIRAAENGREPLRADLIRPIPVLIVYGTAVAEEDGEVRFFEDIYGHDATLAAAMSAAYAERNPGIARQPVRAKGTRLAGSL